MLICTVDFCGSEFGKGMIPPIQELIPHDLFAEMQKIGLDVVFEANDKKHENHVLGQISYRDNLSDMIAQMQNFQLKLSDYNLDDATYAFVNNCIKLEIKTLRQARTVTCKVLEKMFEMEAETRKILQSLVEHHELVQEYLDVSLAWYKTHPKSDETNPGNAIFEKIQAKMQQNGVAS